MSALSRSFGQASELESASHPRRGNLLGVAGKRRQDVGLNGPVVGAGDLVFGAFGNHHAGDDGKVAALRGRE